VLLLSDAPFELRLDELDERIKRRELAVELAPLPARTAEDLLPYLLLGPTGLARWVAGAPVLVDDRPFLEFRAASQIGTTHANFQDILASAAGAIDELEPYLVAPRLSRERRVAVEQVRRAIVAFDRLRPNDFAAQLELLEALPDEARTILAWLAHYRAAIRLAVAAQVPTEGSAAALRPLYERALAHDPTNPDARRFLGKN
jgi:hypothetical protein